MTAPMLMTDCPTEETLAAFIDDRLDAPQRRHVMEHIAGCGECRETVLMTADFQMSEAPTNVIRPRFPWIPTVGVAAAALIAVLALKPAFMFGPDMEDVIEASRPLEYRPSIGKFASDFPYKEVAPTNRGAGTTMAGEAELLTIAENAKDPRVGGVALLQNAAEQPFYESAVEKLREAYEKAEADEKDAVAIDLAAALLSPFASDTDRAEALKLSEEVLARSQNPDAMWNRAAALEVLGHDERALNAWDDYLKRDSTSKWADEARRRQATIREFLTDIAPPPSKP